MSSLRPLELLIDMCIAMWLIEIIFRPSTSRDPQTRSTQLEAKH